MLHKKSVVSIAQDIPRYTHNNMTGGRCWWRADRRLVGMGRHNWVRRTLVGTFTPKNTAPVQQQNEHSSSTHRALQTTLYTSYNRDALSSLYEKAKPLIAAPPPYKHTINRPHFTTKTVWHSTFCAGYSCHVPRHSVSHQRLHLQERQGLWRFTHQSNGLVQQGVPRNQTSHTC